ncbi:Aste57867_3158 [Aphanomyces stellatus]|uniref:Aste57867_3158 protein n=1 Tax=Aphanomyces stellatus TaxID=120398 RepID=A0A485KBJ7_9STRA|nr:hypothetical protein As57867_003149 [Aphanomyces stellatus]VFT80332.1 Aste57867_3158 [Aphanomyces stellatus]
METKDLRVVIALSTHGSRAPKHAVATLCPNNQPNLNAYAVPFEQLTSLGMQQMVHAGAHTRDVYVNTKQFLSPTLKQKDHFDSYFRAEPSLGQNSITFGYGLYPDTTPGLDFPVPVPVVMQLVSNEHDIAVTNGPCQETLARDMTTFAATRGKYLLHKHKAVLDSLADACGAPLETNHDVGVVADMLTSDHAQGLPPLVPADLAAQVQTLAFDQMLEAYLGSERQVTYYVGGFPDLMRAQLDQALNQTSGYKLYAYTGRRELLHGMAFMLGWDFAFQDQPHSTLFNTSALPAGATMFIELHSGPNGEHPVVETHVWSPETNRSQVKLSKCSAVSCPLAEFNAIVGRHINRTQTWQDLCHFHPVNDAKGLHMTGGVSSIASGESAYSLLLCAVFVGLTLFAMHSAFARIKEQNKRREYSAIPDGDDRPTSKRSL